MLRRSDGTLDGAAVAASVLIGVGVVCLLAGALGAFGCHREEPAASSAAGVFLTTPTPPTLVTFELDGTGRRMHYTVVGKKLHVRVKDRRRVRVSGLPPMPGPPPADPPHDDAQGPALHCYDFRVAPEGVEIAGGRPVLAFERPCEPLAPDVGIAPEREEDDPWISPGTRGAWEHEETTL